MSKFLLTVINFSSNFVKQINNYTLSQTPTTILHTHCHWTATCTCCCQ